MPPRIAIVGGDGRCQTWVAEAPTVEIIPSPKFGGHGRIRAFLKALRNGRFILVVLLLGFIDHPTAGRIRKLCREAGIPFKLDGNQNDLRRALR